jgi:hypothetical protein
LIVANLPVLRLLLQDEHNPLQYRLLGIEVFHLVCNASGHAAAAPPSSVMNSRRFMSGMGTSSPMRISAAGWPVRLFFRTSSLPQGGPQVLVANLKCSESRR